MAACLDALPWVQHNAKKVAVGFVTFVFGVYSIQYSYFIFDDVEWSIPALGLKDVSITAMIASADRVLV